MPFDDVGDGVFADTEVAGDPTIALPAVDGGQGHLPAGKLVERIEKVLG